MIYNKVFLFFLSFYALTILIVPATADAVPTYFQKMDDAVQKLLTIQSKADPNAPPDFSVAEKQLFKLGKEIDHATKKLEKYKGTLDDDSVSSIDSSLKDISGNVVIITQAIKDGKPYSDEKGYTLAIERILQAVTAQLSVLFPELFHHLPLGSYASIGYSISVWICSMADAISYLDPNSQTPTGSEFCSTLPSDQTFVPDVDTINSIIVWPQAWFDCSGGALEFFFWGYMNAVIGSPYTDPWCVDVSGSWDFDYSSADWNWYPSDTQWVVQASFSIGSD